MEGTQQTDAAVEDVNKPTAAPEGDATATSAAATAKPEFNPDDLSEEDKNTLLAKLTGGKVKSLADLDKPEPKSKEELEAEAAKRKTDALTWGLTTGKIKKEDYDSALTEKSKTSREIAIRLFTASLKEEDPKLTDEESEEIFRDTYHEDKEPDTRLGKIGQREIEKLANSYRKEKFAVIDNIEPEYENFTKTEANYSAYKKQIKGIAAALPEKLEFKIPYKAPDGTESEISYEIPVDEKIKSKIISEFTDQSTFANIAGRSAKGIDEKALTAELNYHLKARSFDAAVAGALQSGLEQGEELTKVILGNKTTDRAQLANGAQNSWKAPKYNDYSSMHNADSVRGHRN